MTPLLPLLRLFLFGHPKPKPVEMSVRFRPVTDEFAEAVRLLHAARFEVGAKLQGEISKFLTGHGRS